MAKVEVTMTRSVFVEAIAGGDMRIRVTEVHIRCANVGRRDGKA